MVALFLFIFFGLLFGYFATLNTIAVTVYFGLAFVENVPLYLVILAALAIGVLFTTLFYFIESFSKNRASRHKDRELSDLKKENAELLKKNHQLEIENTRITAENGSEPEDENAL